MFSLVKKSNFKENTKLLGLLSSKHFFSQFQEPNSQKKTNQSSVDPREVESFSRIKDWWDPKGSQRALHAYNVARVNYIKRIYHIYSKDKVLNRNRMFEGLDIIDVGCGAGLFCEVSNNSL